MSIHDDSPLFLGLDLSTQGLKAVLITEESEVVHESAVNFDRELPHYNTTNGAIRGPDHGEVTSPVRMWLEAIDLIVQKMQTAGVDLERIMAISGDGQQHGSVYWSHNAEQLLSTLNPEYSLADQLAPAAFTFQRCPIWQDSSTTTDCRALEDAVGGPQALTDITGSRAYERFTGNQIRRLRRLFPETYAATSRISLVSSFLPSLFIGSVAPIEVSDASGMNLMNVLTYKWEDNLLEFCGGPELRQKIGPEPIPGGTVLGRINNYWVSKWGFNPDCLIAPFTGDNPATVVALSSPGDAILSLGTSTTLLLSIPPTSEAPKRFTTSHLLSHPTTYDAHIAMLCYKNGALAREQVRNKYASAHWLKYNQLVQSTSIGNDGTLGFYFPLPEIIPPNVQGNFFFHTNSPCGVQVVAEEKVNPNAHPRAILESQFLSIRSRINAILPPKSPPLQRLVVCGGGSNNDVILQLAADVFGMRVFISGPQGAAEGGAQLARYAWWREQNGGRGTFEELRANDGEDGEKFKLVAEPKQDNVDVYAGMIDKYRECEAEVVRFCANLA
ncbi:actin-like ATPase domain-containing protein [Irpex rosettiformis]|uniref:Actin-like ATPase domain-containing protein n=1 Tax=Irpex rosettiformis TaxID=378272 RepID=A0ACB8UBG8_9APHY|nr:actin-like ATPase domain-containing protein [Irpex rosettiformis]